MTEAEQTLEETIKRLQDDTWIGDSAQRMGELHGVIAALLERQTLIFAAIQETMAEIEYWHADMLTEHERKHPRGSGWARVYDKLGAARDLLKGRSTLGTRPLDELEAMDLMASALAVRHGQTQLKFRDKYQAEAETALRALLTYYRLVRKA